MRVQVRSRPEKNFTSSGGVETVERFDVLVLEETLWRPKWITKETFYTQDEALDYASKLKYPKVVDV